MTTENTEPTIQEKALQAVGATPKDLSEGHTGEGNKAPSAPASRGDDEVHGEPLKKEVKKPETKVEEKTEEKAEETTEETTEPADESWKEQYLEFEDDAGKSVVNLLKAAGVKPVEANAFFAEALKANDINKVRWDLIEARLGKDQAALARIGINDHYNRVYKRNEETRDAGYAAVGGEANWKKVANWVKSRESADPKTKVAFDEIRKGIDAGGKLAGYAFAELVSLYEADKNNSGLGVKKVVQGGKQNSEVVGGPIGKADYLTEMKKLHESGKATQAAVSALRERRRAGIASGI